MKKMNNKGITLISIVVSVIVLLIITGIVISVGSNNANSTKDKKLTTELKMVQHAVLERSTLAIMTKEDVPGSKIENYQTLTSKIDNSIVDKLKIKEADYQNINKYKCYYELNPAQLCQIGILNSENTYIVNYTTGEIINETVVKTTSGGVLYSSLK